MGIRLSLIVIAAMLLAGSCGDDNTGPGGAPTPSVLAADTVSVAGVDLNWSQCPDSDFDSYRLYRSDAPDIESDTTIAELVYAVTAVDSTTYLDTDADQDSTYYYALMTTNTDDLSSWSNEIEVVVPQVELPEGMEFVTISSGSFEMGAPAEEEGTEFDERPVHTVTFDYSFEIMTTEVTQAMWEELMGNNPSHFTGVDLPVECVTWDECQNFADAMNDLDPDHLYRLPSESEWEYCCRAGTTTRFYWGDDPEETEVGDFAWWNSNSNDTTHPVAQKTANDWGLYDMIGNVREWCEDFWHDSYTGAPSDGSPWLVPAGSYIINRGGCWYSTPNGCRSADRGGSIPGDYNFDLGFRLVRTAR